MFVELKKLKLDDAKTLMNLIKDKDVLYNMGAPFTEENITIDFEKNFLKREIEDNIKGDKISLGIYFNGLLVGVIGSKKIKENELEFGYWIGKNYWGKGIVSSAIKLFIKEAFEKFPKKKLTAIVYSINPASIKVLEKNGFKKYKEKKTKHIVYGEEVIDLFYRLEKN
ncbi:MAG: GNAT family N-acetyltransferase [archaeon]|jgi:RimJ/RimL family protein N-acetyltransferase